MNNIFLSFLESIDGISVILHAKIKKFVSLKNKKVHL